MNKTLTAAERATIMDACQSISRSADALKNCHTVDGDWGDDLDAKAFYDAELRLLERLTALLAAQQPKPQCTCDMRTKVLGDGCAICQPESRAEVTDDDKLDAERYRWLREQSNDPNVLPRIEAVRWEAIDESANGGEGLRMKSLDAAIDAARAGEGQC
ncbi:hypothetical protein BLA3211_06899 [Burkholderia aenigmatica]|uniref:Uncharacterized protein n=1 Tax=Burkholderia aenigmatica TaxID=2015348 RepID=A0A6J5JLE7_9BURK|nr:MULTISPECIES: hypothetical protein [Burkholderia]CAB3972300.1 hypothetical protein BLA3211_06899 [Burkholderia aenigmatica]